MMAGFGVGWVDRVDYFITRSPGKLVRWRGERFYGTDSGGWQLMSKRKEGQLP